MRYKTFKCLQRDFISDTDKWVYTWKEFVGGFSILHPQYMFCFWEHRVPFFLSPHAHIIIERTLENLTRALFQQFPCRKTLLVYDILHGIICAYNAIEILHFWNGRAQQDC
jgi:hypothetical protein